MQWELKNWTINQLCVRDIQKCYGISVSNKEYIYIVKPISQHLHCETNQLSHLLDLFFIQVKRVFSCIASEAKLVWEHFPGTMYHKRVPTLAKTKGPERKQIWKKFIFMKYRLMSVVMKSGMCEVTVKPRLKDQWYCKDCWADFQDFWWGWTITIGDICGKQTHVQVSYQRWCIMMDCLHIERMGWQLLVCRYVMLMWNMSIPT